MYFKTLVLITGLADHGPGGRLHGLGKLAASKDQDPGAQFRR